MNEFPNFNVTLYMYVNRPTLADGTVHVKLRYMVSCASYKRIMLLYVNERIIITREITFNIYASTQLYVVAGILLLSLYISCRYVHVHVGM